MITRRMSSRSVNSQKSLMVKMCLSLMLAPSARYLFRVDVLMCRSEATTVMGHPGRYIQIHSEVSGWPSTENETGAIGAADL